MTFNKLVLCCFPYSILTFNWGKTFVYWINFFPARMWLRRMWCDGWVAALVGSPLYFLYASTPCESSKVAGLVWGESIRAEGSDNTLLKSGCQKVIPLDVGWAIISTYCREYNQSLLLPRGLCPRRQFCAPYTSKVSVIRANTVSSWTYAAEQWWKKAIFSFFFSFLVY